MPAFSYANVMATVAVFVALGGTSYAAVQITGKDVKDASLTSRDIKDRSLLAGDFKPGQLPGGAKGAAGPQGEPGPQGPHGERGAQGAPGKDASLAGLTLTGAEIDESSLATVPNAAALDGRGASSFEQPTMGTRSFGGTRAESIITTGGMYVRGLCAHGHPTLGTGAAVTLSNVVRGPLAKAWLVRNGVAHYDEFSNSDFMGADIRPLLATGPQVFVFQGIDATGKMFRATATSRYVNGNCEFTAWGATEQ